VDVDAGHGAALGRALPSPGVPLTRRLRALLSWQPPENDPVTSLVKTHRSIHPSGDFAVLRHAYKVADNCHRGQMRKSGDPYITHPLAVAEILAEMGMDTTTLIAALLHDTVEDTSYTLEALRGDFGDEVAHLVDGVTKFDKAFYGKAAESETIRKMIVAAGKDVRVLIIKLADRVHNMRTLGARSNASRERIAKATLDVLVPLCDKLGIQWLKRELDDVVLLHLQPDAHERIASHVANRPGWDEYLGDVVRQSKAALRRQRVTAAVTPRPRHLYSIWKDTVRGEYTTPFDLPRIAIVIDGSETDCYMALGAIHSEWRPVPGRFKDFIASPKNNLYRSLHTTITGPEGRTVEVLIRTEAMHRLAEYGVAAPYRFPKLVARGEGAEQLDWLHRVLDWEPEAKDSAVFLSSLRCELAESQIQVFCEGRPVVLPLGATSVDLAYEVGTESGDRCVAVTINGRTAPMLSELAEGDVIELILDDDGSTDPDGHGAHRGPHRDWLQHVKTSNAQLTLNRRFAEEDAPGMTITDKVRLGRATIGLTLLREHNRGLASERPLLRLAEQLGYPDLETLLVAVFDRTVDPDELARKLVASVDHPD
jgi:GTP diphosphokinase / guanosine-3',5'-bis(diphosphate) 3'-diphosphatase